MGNKASKLPELHEQDNSSSQHVPPDQNPAPPDQDGGLPVREDNRFRASSLLASNGVQNVVWLEDLLALHGSDTMVWDLNLLVQNPPEAATCLLKLGYRRTVPEARFQHDLDLGKNCIRLIRPESAETPVVLLPAQDWYYEMQDHSQNRLPPLHFFLDSVMEYWLSISSKDYVDRLDFALYIAALINYCYALKDKDGNKVKSIEYGDMLKVENRELHYDILAGKQSFTHTARHRCHAQKHREIKAALFTPEPYQKDGYRSQLATLSE
jgi:hypothetical protein